MSDEEKLRQLQRQIRDGIERVRRSIQQAKWLLSRISQMEVQNSIARAPKFPGECERKSKTG
jgi:hypothetical protein